jgi:hypothetical protein
MIIPLLTLVLAVHAGEPVPTSKVAAAKSTAARRVYNMASTQGGAPTIPPAGVSWDDRTVRFVQAPNDIDVAVYATTDSGKPECVVAYNHAGNIGQAEKMGLPVPTRLFDKRCSGLKRDIKAWTMAEVDPHDKRADGIKFKSETIRHLKKTQAERELGLDQRQLDIFFSLIEDCLKNGV